jgi:RNA polymerase sigma factor (TIGR02999 family)
MVFRGRFTLSCVDPVNTTLSSLVATAEQGDAGAADALFTALYGELHRLARAQLARQGGSMTLGATALLHEAYLDISARDALAFPDRARFMGYAARVMRGLIIDYARNRQAQKRGGLFELTAIKTELLGTSAAPDAAELTRLGEALDELATVDARLANVVDLKFFCGFTFEEIAAMSGVSERTVQRDWEKARIYLHRVLRDDAAV